MKIWKKVFLMIFVFSLITIANGVFAQCAMCQATVESNLDNGGSAGRGLNNGIMYLLAAPYLAIMGVGYLWYKKYRKRDVELNIKKEKIHLN